MRNDLTLENIKAKRAYIERCAKAGYQAYMEERRREIMSDAETIPRFESLTENVRHAWRKAAMSVESEIMEGRGMIEMRWVIAPSQSRELEYRFQIAESWSDWRQVNLVAVSNVMMAKNPGRDKLCIEIADNFKKLEDSANEVDQPLLGKLRENLGDFGIRV